MAASCDEAAARLPPFGGREGAAFCTSLAARCSWACDFSGRGGPLRAGVSLPRIWRILLRDFLEGAMPSGLFALRDGRSGDVVCPILGEATCLLADLERGRCRKLDSWVRAPFGEVWEADAGRAPTWPE